ncbi:flagellar basal body P-ring formation chaperone FlgA [Variovorax sp. J22P240]|uniref:flagellar basal body P-ring formation chaperone FlgA n=1 Tax=Variovorax sp. J22P240 TaxID=3053514 RepID=UPI0025765531|nr:flagellar basal body P-ring formation chaperone FlgA [Variovorax sp. J22P240]MDM0001559.1 flagellar basal body P-ring formation chaperone FlgA [Variovorax sp. J22P240]
MELRKPWSRLLCIVLPTVMAGVGSATASAAAALPDAARSAIDKLLQVQTAGLPGKVTFGIKASASTALPPCEDFEAFMPAGTAPWGRVSIGLRCRGEKPWMRFVPVHVAVEGRYFVAARAIEAGEAVGAADVTERTGDLSALPRSVITDAAALRGVVTANRVGAGAPLRKELMRGLVVIQQGQTVQLVAQGQGFSVSTEGKAMTRAEVGATVQAKTRDGRLLTGIAGEDGQIRLAQ